MPFYTHLILRIWNFEVKIKVGIEVDVALLYARPLSTCVSNFIVQQLMLVGHFKQWSTPCHVHSFSDSCRGHTHSKMPISKRSLVGPGKRILVLTHAQPQKAWFQSWSLFYWVESHLCNSDPRQWIVCKAQNVRSWLDLKTDVYKSASMVKWTKNMFRYIKAIKFLVKRPKNTSKVFFNF